MIVHPRHLEMDMDTLRQPSPETHAQLGSMGHWSSHSKSLDLILKQRIALEKSIWDRSYHAWHACAPNSLLLTAPFLERLASSFIEVNSILRKKKGKKGTNTFW